MVKNPLLNISYFFGYDVYIHVPKKKRSKLDTKYEKCIFLGYKDIIKGYKIWNPITKNIVYSLDIVFREVKGVPKWEALPREK